MITRAAAQSCTRLRFLASLAAARLSLLTLALRSCHCLHALSVCRHSVNSASAPAWSCGVRRDRLSAPRSNLPGLPVASQPHPAPSVSIVPHQYLARHHPPPSPLRRAPPPSSPWPTCSAASTTGCSASSGKPPPSRRVMCVRPAVGCAIRRRLPPAAGPLKPEAPATWA